MARIKSYCCAITQVFVSFQMKPITEDMIIKPPISVQNAGTSLIKTQTQKGPKANSANINKVSSAANKCLEEYKKITFGIREIKLPSRTHRSKSNQVNERFFPIIKKQNRLIITPEIAKLRIPKRKSLLTTP